MRTAARVPKSETNPNPTLMDQRPPRRTTRCKPRGRQRIRGIQGLLPPPPPPRSRPSTPIDRPILVDAQTTAGRRLQRPNQRAQSNCRGGVGDSRRLRRQYFRRLVRRVWPLQHGLFLKRGDQLHLLFCRCRGRHRGRPPSANHRYVRLLPPCVERAMTVEPILHCAQRLEGGKGSGGVHKRKSLNKTGKYRTQETDRAVLLTHSLI